MRICLTALGCRLNEAELEAWARQFQQQGHRITADQETADLVVVNTCAVTTEAVRKSRKLLRRTRRTNPRAKVVVSGCFASLEGKSLTTEQGIDLLVPNQDKDRLVEIAVRDLELQLDRDREPAQPPLAAIEPGADPLFGRGRQRAFVKVQDGCRYRCTFCIVTLARGEERSRPLPEIIAEIDRLRSRGVQEVVLTGVHLGGYGSDRGQDLAGLLRAILAATDIPRIRMGSLEPWDLPHDFWRLFEDPRLMPHLHLPLQSGSDSVLRRMSRRCSTGEYARLIEEARRQVPDFNATTDIIVGFPGETADEWHQTLVFVETIGFGHLHIFPYSQRPGTKAATLPGQVPGQIKKDRSRRMHELGRGMKHQTLARHIGRRLPVLVEGRYGAAPDGDWFGYTANYLPVRVRAQAGEAMVNRILEVEIEAVHRDGESLLGSP